MAFRVEISPQAFDDLDAIATFLTRKSSLAVSDKWFNGIIDDIRSLCEKPARCARAPESELLGAEIRLLLHGKRNRRYKIYFAIYERTKTVRIFHVRHWAQHPIGGDEVKSRLETGP